MKKAILFIVSSCLTGILLVIFLFLSIILTPKNIFKDNYNAALRTKFKILKETNEPKIIIITGSSASFSLDNELLEKETNMKIANLGLHAGMGALFETELSKANINEGDIILLGFEWDWPTEKDYVSKFGSDLIMLAIDDDIEIYKYIPISKYKNILNYLPTFADKKRTYLGGDTGIYSRSAFDENGNYVINREGSPITTIYNQQDYGYVDVTDTIIPEETIEYFRTYKEYVESKNASIYWIGCPVWEGAVINEHSEFQKIVNQVEEKIGIDYISNPIDYIFQDEYMYDTIYHTNSYGQKYRTELLINDLIKANIIK